MPRLIDDEATYIPNDVLDESESMDAAQQWGDGARADAVQQWGDFWRGQVGGALGQAGEAIGGGLGAAGEALQGPLAGPLVGGLRQTAGFEQMGREQSALLSRQSELVRRLDAGDQSVLPELQFLESTLNQAFTESPYETYKRSPEQLGLELGGGLAQGVVAGAVAPSLGAGLARNVAGSVIDPGGQIISSAFQGAGRGLQAFHAGEAGELRLPGGGDEAAKAAAEAEMRASFGKGIERDVQLGNIAPEALSPEQAALRAEVTDQDLASLVTPGKTMNHADLFDAATEAGIVQTEAEYTARVLAESQEGKLSLGGLGSLRGAKKNRSKALSPGGEGSYVERPIGPPPGGGQPPTPPVGSGEGGFEGIHPHEDDIWHAVGLGLIRAEKNVSEGFKGRVNSVLRNNPAIPVPTTKTLQDAIDDLGAAPDLARRVLADPRGKDAKELTILRLSLGEIEDAAEAARIVLKDGGGSLAMQEKAMRDLAAAGVDNLEIRLVAARRLGEEAGRTLQAMKIAVSNVRAESAAESAKYVSQAADDLAKAVSRSKGEIDPDVLRRWEDVKAWYEKNAGKLAETPVDRVSDADLAGVMKAVGRKARRPSGAGAATEAGGAAGVRSTPSAAGAPPQDLTALGRRYIQLNREAAEARSPGGVGVDRALEVDAERQELLKEIDRLLNEEVAKALAKEKKLPRTAEQAQAVLEDAMARPIIARRRREIKEQLLGWPKGKFLGGLETRMQAQLARDMAKADQQAQKFTARTSMAVEKELNKTYQGIEREAAGMEKTAVTITLREKLARIDQFLKAGGDPRQAKQAIDALRGLGTQARVMAGQFERDVAKATATRMVGSEEWNKLSQARRDDLVASLVNPELWEDPRAAGKFAASMAVPSNWDKAFGMRLASMLSGPPTLVINLLGSLGETAWVPASRLTAGLIERAIPVERVKVDGVQVRNATERMALDELSGWMNGWRLALKEGAATLKTGVSSRPIREIRLHATDIVPRSMTTTFGAGAGAITAQAGLPEETTLEERLAAGAKGAALGAVGGAAVGTKIPRLGVSPLNGVFRIMAATDDTLRALNKGGAMMAEARREATARGVSLDKIMLNLVDYPQVVSRTMRQVERRTYTEELGGLAKLLAQSRSRNVAIQTFIPFWNTIANIAKMGAERTPYGFYKAQQLAGEGKFAEAATMRAEATLGSGIMGVAGWFAANELVTGYGPSEPEDRRLWFAKGYQPYSIRVGDRWISYAGMGSLVVPLGIAASVADAARYGKTGRDEDLSQRLLYAMKSFGNLFLNVTALRGVSDVVNVITDPDRYFPKLAESLVASHVPATGFLSALARAFDAEVKDPQNVFETLAARMPGMTGAVQPKLGPLGEPVERGSTGVASALFPIRATQVKHDPVIDEYARLRGQGFQVSPPTPGESVHGLVLRPGEQAGYTKTRGRVLRAAMGTLIGFSEYRQLPGEAQAFLIQQVEDWALQGAEKEFTPALLEGMSEEQLQERVAQMVRDRVLRGQRPLPGRR